MDNAIKVNGNQKQHVVMTHHNKSFISLKVMSEYKSKKNISIVNVK